MKTDVRSASKHKSPNLDSCKLQQQMDSIPKSTLRKPQSATMPEHRPCPLPPRKRPCITEAIGSSNGIASPFVDGQNEFTFDTNKKLVLSGQFEGVESRFVDDPTLLTIASDIKLNGIDNLREISDEGFLEENVSWQNRDIGDKTNSEDVSRYYLCNDSIVGYPEKNIDKSFCDNDKDKRLHYSDVNKSNKVDTGPVEYINKYCDEMKDAGSGEQHYLLSNKDNNSALNHIKSSQLAINSVCNDGDDSLTSPMWSTNHSLIVSMNSQFNLTSMNGGNCRPGPLSHDVQSMDVSHLFVNHGSDGEIDETLVNRDFNELGTNCAESSESTAIDARNNVYFTDEQQTDQGGQNCDNVGQYLIGAVERGEYLQTEDGLIIVRNPDGSIQIHGTSGQTIPLDAVQALFSVNDGGQSYFDATITNESSH